LDVGCSSGAATAALAPYFAQTLGVEYDPLALQNVDWESQPPVQYLRGDAMSLPLGNESVDVVICAQVYEHVPDDERLVAEIYRVLKPGGLVFFSGPNWLFPIEPHYFLPFLHWLPEAWADRYLKVFRKGDHYYERSRSPRGLRRLLRAFVIRDVTVDLLADQTELMMPARLAPWLRWVPRFFWTWLLPVLPNFNWLLSKPRSGMP
jgi:SAM-dependent methyltransferase